MLNSICISIAGIITSMCSSITWASSALVLISHIQISIQLAVQVSQAIMEYAEIKLKKNTFSHFYKHELGRCNLVKSDVSKNQKTSCDNILENIKRKIHTYMQ